MSILSTTLADYTNLLSQTWGDRWGGRVSSIVDQSPLLAIAMRKGAVKFSAAPYATRPFTHAQNPNIQTYAGTETLNSATFEHTKLLKWEQWGQISCQCVVPVDDIDKNSGAEHAVESLLETEEMICAETMAQFIEEQLHTASVSSKDVQGLRDQIEFDTIANQAGTSVAGIAKSAALGWYNQYEAIPGSFAVEGVKSMKKLYRKCSRYGRSPDLVLCDESIYDAYEDYLGPLQQLESRDKATVGFKDVCFKDAVMVADYNITADSGELFMLQVNPKAPSSDTGFNFDASFLDPVKGKSKGAVNQGNLQLWFNKNAFFKSSDWREAEDQHVLKNKNRVSLQLTFSNLREQGCADFSAGSFQA
jgi:hypothetical protein